MKSAKFTKILSLVVCIVLVAAMALFAIGCSDNNTTDSSSAQSTTLQADTKVYGNGQTKFTFTVVDANGVESKFEINTDKTTVGDALLEHNLIAGEEAQYGLYVKTVNGITVDFDKDGKYWAFYVNGEYGASGVDTTSVTAGATYTFKVE